MVCVGVDTSCACEIRLWQLGEQRSAAVRLIMLLLLLPLPLSPSSSSSS
eukprot:COSAG06_NODE_26205_length_619_cov_2.026923_1_plen_48_part_10